MQSLEDYKITLNKLFLTIQTANQHALRGNLVDLSEAQDLIDQETKQLRIILDAFKFNSFRS